MSKVRSRIYLKLIRRKIFCFAYGIKSNNQLLDSYEKQAICYCRGVRADPF